MGEDSNMTGRGGPAVIKLRLEGTLGMLRVTAGTGWSEGS